MSTLREEIEFLVVSHKKGFPYLHEVDDIIEELAEILKETKDEIVTKRD